MFRLSISINKKKESSINKTSAYSHEMLTEKTMSIKGAYAKKMYDSLIETLDTKEVHGIVLSKSKKKDSTIHWKIGETVVEFITDINTNGVDIKNLTRALSKSIGGTPDFWDLHLKFYSLSPNGEYNKYPWNVCIVLARTIRPLTRNILIIGHDKNKIKNQNVMNQWKDIIERGDIRKLALGRLAILKVLRKGDETEKSLARKAHLSKDSVRGRVSELNGIHGYNIIKKKDLYHLIPNDNKREKIISDAKASIKKIRSNLET